MRRRPSSWTMLAPLLAVAIGCSGDSDGNVIGPPTLRVGTSGTANYASIQRAVDAAPSGATILVEPGVFTESVEISRALTITGSGPGTVVEFPADGPADSAVITAHDLSGLRIEALSVRASRPDVDGIRVRDATSVVLRSIVASGNSKDGVDIRRSSGIDIFSGIFENNGGDGIQVDDRSSSIAIVSNRTASNVGDGFKISLASDVLLQDNVATLNGDDGIQVGNSNRVRLVRNASTSNIGWGIAIMESPDTVLDRNTAAGNGAGDVKCEPEPCP